MTNEAIKQVNKSRRRSFSPLPEQAELITPERVLLDHEERERLWLAVQGLSADHRGKWVIREFPSIDLFVPLATKRPTLLTNQVK